MNMTKLSTKKDGTVNFFKILFGDVGTIARLFELSFDNNAFHTSDHANKLPNKQTVFYIFWLGNMKYMQKSLFQVTKMQKMNIRKDSTNNTEQLNPVTFVVGTLV